MARKTLLLGLVVLSSVACGDSTTTRYSNVELSNIPSCEGESLFHRPVIVELTSGDTRIQRIVLSASRTRQVSLPEGEARWRARFGLCRRRTSPESPSYRCGQIDWYARQEVTLDPRRPGETLSLPTPPEGLCRP
jgi:hypothetical protein